MYSRLRHTATQDWTRNIMHSRQHCNLARRGVFITGRGKCFTPRTLQSKSTSSTDPLINSVSDSQHKNCLCHSLSIFQESLLDLCLPLLLFLHTVTTIQFLIHLHHGNIPRGTFGFLSAPLAGARDAEQHGQEDKAVVCGEEDD